MKQILLSVLAVTLLFASSCIKNESWTPANNNWTVGATNYLVQVTGNYGTGNGVVFSNHDNSHENSLTIAFHGSTLPTGGTFKVVGNASPAAGEMYVQASGPTTSYVATGYDNISAAVTANDGKISISLPKIWAKNSFGGSDSLQISASVYQY